MADQPNEKAEAAAPAVDAQETLPTENKTAEVVEETEKTGEEASKDDANVAEETEAPESSEKPAEKTTESGEEAEKSAADKGDVEMNDTTEAPAADGDSAPAAPIQTPAKSKARRKSVGGSLSRTLSKKGSKARLTNLDAQPGDHYLVKLKGFPAWPAVVCDESMLPPALTETRPVTAMRPDGTWNEPYAEGGKRAYDRNFPVMYLHTNEFGWVLNSNLTQLSPEKAENAITDKMRKDLKEAYILAAENNPIEHYKEILQRFEEELVAQEEARALAAATPKKSKKGKTKAVDEDVDMADADATPAEKPKSSKKRKAEDDISTPQRPDSVKKPKIKLNTSSTPKTANGTSTPKAKDDAAAKSKPKSKKAKETAEKKTEAPKEPKLTPEERHARKEKEVLYLRHKLQRGLLTRDQQPQETEMKAMSDYINHLEGFDELEVSIIRTTKINKVLKAILKLESIPREDEFNFKSRSQALLDKWTKLMNGDAAPAPAAATNGVNGSAETKSDGPEVSKKADSEKPEEDASEDKPETTAEAKSASPAEEEKSDKPSTDEAVVPPAPVETTA